MYAFTKAEPLRVNVFAPVDKIIHPPFASVVPIIPSIKTKLPLDKPCGAVVVISTRPKPSFAAPETEIVTIRGGPHSHGRRFDPGGGEYLSDGVAVTENDLISILLRPGC
jgi:hypothetical protein